MPETPSKRFAPATGSESLVVNKVEPADIALGE